MKDIMKINGLTPEEYSNFYEELKDCPCNKQEIDVIFQKYFPTLNLSTEYPIEWYHDKDNRLKGFPTGYLCYRNKKMVWKLNKRV